uniref:Uncharacterized protein n=1 Tax=Knipowitschia caucasica TaxID=637954 RepID=A0AAV2M6V5_KNICA
MAHIDTAVISKTVIVPRAHLWPPPPASSKGGMGRVLEHGPLPCAIQGPTTSTQAQVGARCPILFPIELNSTCLSRSGATALQLPPKRSTVDHRASSHLWASRDRSPLPAPVCGKDWSVCVPALRA